jgi:hypothetical protein
MAVFNEGEGGDYRGFARFGEQGEPDLVTAGVLAEVGR